MADESCIALPGRMQLAEVVRSGKPVAGVDTADGREFFPRLEKVGQPSPVRQVTHMKGLFEAESFIPPVESLLSV